MEEVDQDYTFRRGRNGDKSATGYMPIPPKPPTYVLLYRGEQVGAAHGGVDCICHIEIFESYRNRDHCTKFVELWERWGRRLECNRLKVSPVTNPQLAHILEKLGFELIEEGTYVKKL